MQSPLAVLFAALAILADAHAGESRTHPLDRTIRLNLWGAGLNEAAREIQRQTGVPVLFYRPDLPEDRNADAVYLVTGQVPLRAVVECLARRFAFRYRVSPEDRLELSGGYGWVEDKPVLKFLSLDDLVPSGGGNADELQALLDEFVKPRILIPGDTRIAIEKSPAPGNPHAMRCVSALPAVLSDHLEKAIQCLSGRPGDFPPSDRNGQRPYAFAPPEAENWERLLERRVRLSSGTDLRSLLADICDQAGVAIILTPGAFTQARGLESEQVGLGRASEILAARFGLGRRIFLKAGAISFEEGTGDPLETDSRSRELFWGGLAVAGFDARSAADRAGSGQALVELIRKNVFPSLWRDPACAIGYSQVTGRLAVIAPLNVVEAVAGRLGAASMPPGP